MRRLALAFTLALAGTSVVRAEEPLRVSAAASLTESFREIAAAFEKANPGAVVELNLAGSQVLRTQIEQGARADVFASADLAHAGALRKAGLLGPTEVFARNRLVVVTPAEKPRVRGLQDVVRPGVKLVIAGATVPAGRYTLQALGRIAAAGLHGDDFQARALANVVSEETSVRAVLSKVALGEADAGFVYATDAATAPTLRVIDIPARSNVIAEYPIGVLAKAPSATRAAAFVRLVLSPEGQAVLQKHGFAR